jgi:hypothetical protein
MGSGKSRSSSATDPSKKGSTTPGGFATGQGAIYTPDPTLNGPWTHTRADIPLFKQQPAAVAGSTVGTGGTGGNRGPSSGGFSGGFRGGDDDDRPRPPAAPPNYSYFGAPSMNAPAAAAPVAPPAAGTPTTPPMGMGPGGRHRGMGDGNRQGMGQGNHRGWGQGGMASNPAFQQWRTQMDAWRQQRPAKPDFRSMLADILAGK